jgi:hypothetical protein
MRRATLASFALLASSLAAVAGSSSPASASDGPFCGPSPVPAPCIETLTVNGVTKTSGAYVSGPTDEGGWHQLGFAVTLPLAATDVVDVVIDGGTAFDPQRMFGRMGLDDVDTWTGPDGGHRMRIHGTPVTWANGCDSNTPWPWVCPADGIATSDDVVFDADIADFDDPAESTIGMYVGTDAAYNGIFFDEQPDGSHALTTEVVAPHLHADGTTPVVGDIRFRLSYAQMRSDMGIPNPETLTPGSLSGTINGGAGGGSFTTWHDPDGGGFFIEASGFTFSLKKLKVAAAHITPTRPTITRAKRVSATRAKLAHTVATPRGAKVTGYLATCTPRHGKTVRATGTASSAKVVVKGLHRGTAYQCKVAATSKAGRGAWSAPAKVKARP